MAAFGGAGLCLGGIALHIQKYSQGNLLLDVEVSSATFNTGLSLSLFAINQ